MTGKEFVRRARRYAKETGQACRLESGRGKGSHGLLYVGTQRTIVANGELKSGTLRAMFRQLKIGKEDF